MVLEASDGAKTESARCAGNGGGAAADRHTVSASAWGARMPYIFVRENAIKYWCTVQGLNHNEVRMLAEKVQDQPEHHDDRQKKAEFSQPTWVMLNALEQMGYRVVTSGPYITGTAKHDQREFIWTMYKSHDDWESSSK